MSDTSLPCQPSIGSFLLILHAASTVGCSDGQPAADRLERWTLAPEVRIGSVDTPGYTFGHITGLVVGRDAEVYVTQWQDPTITVYDANGRYARTLGGEGGGPGEFAMPGAMGWLSDTLWVSDPLLARTSLLARDGSVYTTVKFFIEIESDDPHLSLYGIEAKPAAMLANGIVIASSPVVGSLSAKGEHPLIPVVRATRDGRLLDTLFVQDVNGTSVMFSHGEGFTLKLSPFQDTRLWWVAPRGSAVVAVERRSTSDARSDSFRVTKFAADGDTIFDRHYAYTPIAALEDLVSRVADADDLDWIDDPVERRRHRRAYLEALQPPEFLTPVSNLVVGHDGTIWLRREETWQDSIRWEVLDVAGEPLAELDLPRELRIMQAQRDAVWAIEQDELDVSYIVRFRVKDAVD